MDKLSKLLGDMNHPSQCEGIYKCHSCSKCFGDQRALAQHQQAHNSNFDYSCRYCKENFPNFNARQAHHCLERHLCSYCGELMDSSSMKKAHEQGHSDKQNGIQCDICNKTFYVRCAFKQHQRNEHSNTEKQFSCSECPRKYKYESRLRFHMKKTHTTRTTYKCAECGAQLKDAAALRDHRNQSHSVVNHVITCSVCHELVSVHSMNKHMDSHNSRKTPVACDECDLLLPTKVIVEDHKRHSHWACKSCDLRFQSKYALKKHRVLVHRIEENNFRCSYCDKSFFTASDLKRHLLSHFEQRPLKCGLCEFKAKTEGTLRDHHFMKHETNVKKYQCEECSLLFKRLSELTRHRKIHTQEKLYFHCTKCDKKFEYEGNRNKHERLHCNRRILVVQDSNVAVNRST